MPLLMHLHGLLINGYICMPSFYLFLTLQVIVYFAIAVSYLYGINTPPNFKQPFKAH